MAPLRRQFTGAHVDFDADGGHDIAELVLPRSTWEWLTPLQWRVDPDGLFPEYAV